MRTRIGCVTAVVLMTVAYPASAQNSEPPRVTVGVAGGIANPMHGDFDFVTPEWQVSVRGRLADGVTFEGFFNEWRHTEETFFGQVTQETVRRTRVVGLNVLGGKMGDRGGWSAGGGIGSMTFDRKFTQQDGTGRQFTNTFSNSSFSVQALGGFDVRIVPRLLGYGQFLLAVPTTDPGSGHISVTGGVRVVLW